MSARLCNCERRRTCRKKRAEEDESLCDSSSISPCLCVHPPVQDKLSWVTPPQGGVCACPTPEHSSCFSSPIPRSISSLLLTAFQAGRSSQKVHSRRALQQQHAVVECSVDYDMGTIVIETDTAAQTGYFWSPPPPPLTTTSGQKQRMEAGKTKQKTFRF